MVLVTPMATLSPSLFVALVAGYVSHLVADALNKRGVPLLWPAGRSMRLLPSGVRSGGVAEFAVALVVAAGAACGIYALHLAGAFATRGP